MSSKVKKPKPQPHVPSRGAAAKPAPGTSARRRLILAAVGILTCAAVWAVFEFVVWNTLPPELVGKWVVLDGPQEGATFDFYRGGAMIGRVNAGEMQKIIDARVVVEGKKIYSTTTNIYNGQRDTFVLTIRTLNAKRLVVEDAGGNLMNMERAE